MPIPPISPNGGNHQAMQMEQSVPRSLPEDLEGKINAPVGGVIAARVRAYFKMSAVVVAREPSIQLSRTAESAKISERDIDHAKFSAKFPRLYKSPDMANHMGDLLKLKLVQVKKLGEVDDYESTDDNEKNSLNRILLEKIGYKDEIVQKADEKVNKSNKLHNFTRAELLTERAVVNGVEVDKTIDETFYTEAFQHILEYKKLHEKIATKTEVGEQLGDAISAADKLVFKIKAARRNLSGEIGKSRTVGKAWHIKSIVEMTGILKDHAAEFVRIFKVVRETLSHGREFNDLIRPITKVSVEDDASRQFKSELINICKSFSHYISVGDNDLNDDLLGIAYFELKLLFNNWEKASRNSSIISEENYREFRNSLAKISARYVSPLEEAYGPYNGQVHNPLGSKKM